MKWRWIRLEIESVIRYNNVKLSFVSEDNMNYLVKSRVRFCKIDENLFNCYSYVRDGVLIEFVAEDYYSKSFRKNVVRHLQKAIINNETVNLVVVVASSVAEGCKLEYLRKVEFSMEH